MCYSHYKLGIYVALGIDRFSSCAICAGPTSAPVVQVSTFQLLPNDELTLLHSVLASCIGLF